MLYALLLVLITGGWLAWKRWRMSKERQLFILQLLSVRGLLRSHDLSRIYRERFGGDFFYSELADVWALESKGFIKKSLIEARRSEVRLTKGSRNPLYWVITKAGMDVVRNT